MGSDAVSSYGWSSNQLLSEEEEADVPLFMKPLPITKVFGLRNKSWILTCRKERSELKEGRNKGLVIAKSLLRVTEWPPSRLKF
uniref:Uncharacterized protein n=1 Tax=Solanum tuberosum TaxID=4113 RepID=M1DXS9_SOLTU